MSTKKQKSVGIEKLSSEELGLLLEQQYQQIKQIETNIILIRQILMKRKQENEKENDKK